MKRLSPWIVVLVALYAFASVGWAQSASQSIVPAVVGPADEGPSAANAELLRQALAELSRGEFQAGTATLRRVKADAEVEDGSLERVSGWMSDFQTRRSEDDRRRQSELDEAIDQGKTLLAIAATQSVDAAELDLAREALRDAVEVLSDMLAAPRNADLYVAPSWYAERMADNVETVGESFQEVRDAFEDLDGVRSQAVMAGLAKAGAGIEAYVAAAGELDWSSVDAGEVNIVTLEAESLALTDAADSLLPLVSEQPWRVALDQLRLARMIAGDRAEFLQDPWALEVIAGAEAQAAEYESQREWYKALGLYNGLANLFNDDGRYKDQMDRVSRHARILALYGQDKDDDNETDAEEPGGEAEEPSQPTRDDSRWQEHVRGVDAAMVRRAIGQIEESYVENVDYAKLLVGALEAVRLLADSPELRETFVGLADEDARAGFIQRVDELIAEVEGEDRISHRMVMRWLNAVLSVNRRTIDLPEEVIDVEFADGMMEQLDRFSMMIWPDEWDDFEKHTMGKFSGVGIQIQMENGLLKVVSPLEDTPAYRAGIQAGDFITAIDGASAENIDIEEAVRRITGQEGTVVTLTIKRPGREPMDFPLTRAEIHIQTVKGWKRSADDRWDWMLDRENGIGYIRITSFTKDTVGDLREALNELNRQGARGLVLDLRDNPGGFLDAAIGVADQFVRKGTIVSTRGRAQHGGVAQALPGGTFLDGEMIVLVNDYSASAAEIVSGALKDLDRATIVGLRTFGKGSVQNLIPVRRTAFGENEAFVKVTTAYYYLPNGRCLHRKEGDTVWGVEPDVHVGVTPKQLRRWLTIRRRTEIIQPHDQEILEKQMDEQLRADIQLDTALLLCRLRLMGGETSSSFAQVGG